MPDDEYEDPELAALEAMAEEQRRTRFRADRDARAEMSNDGGSENLAAARTRRFMAEHPPERDIGQQNDLPMDPDWAEWEAREARRVRRGR